MPAAPPSYPAIFISYDFTVYQPGSEKPLIAVHYVRKQVFSGFLCVLRLLLIWFPFPQELFSVYPPYYKAVWNLVFSRKFSSLFIRC
jgi:hypothetical protein